jgi:hypothetical protein
MMARIKSTDCVAPGAVSPVMLLSDCFAMA